MDARRGEKIGWVGGWLGGFLWVILLAVLWSFQGKYLEGLSGMVLGGAAVLAVFAAAPWKHPNTQFWKLMVPIYALLAASIAWAVWAAGGSGELGLNGWQVFLLFPLLIPLGTMGKRRWGDLS